MNKVRRAVIDKAIALVAEARALLEEARDEEQDYYDAMPESLQGGDKGARAQQNVETLENAVNSAEEIENMEFE